MNMSRIHYLIIKFTLLRRFSVRVLTVTWDYREIRATEPTEHICVYIRGVCLLFWVYNKFGLKVTSVGVFSNSIVVVNKDLRYIIFSQIQLSI
jgi:hypothetical protein